MTELVNTLVYATKNVSKIEYFDRWCMGLQMERRTVLDYLGISNLEVEEDGTTIEANAAKKAQFWSARIPGVLVVANDCGIDIPILGDLWDGSKTKRILGGDSVSDIDKIHKMLEIMSPYHGDERKVQWKDAIALGYNGLLIGVTSAYSPSGYLLEDIPENSIIINGAPLATLEFVEEFGKPYCMLTSTERKSHEKLVVEHFQSWIKDITLSGIFNGQKSVVVV